MKGNNNMNEQNILWSRTALIAGFTTIGLVLATAGCGSSEQTSSTDAADSVPAVAKDVQTGEEAVQPAALAAAIPAPEVPADALTLADVYPTLSAGALRYARLTELPDGVLLQAEGVSVTQGDLEKDLADVPPKMREEMQSNAFFLLEQKATMELVTAMARREAKDPSVDDDQLLRGYFDNLTQGVSVTDDEISTFYAQNGNMMGGASLEQMKPRIREHLQQQKQQEMVESHIADLGRKMTIALSETWVKEQAAAALDNIVDKARTSGIPTFVNFGSEGCIPCDKMIPLRAEIKKEYAGKLNVVFVPVNEERMLSSRYGVRGIPHLVFFDKDGKQVHTHTGFMPKEQLEEWLAKSGVAM